MANDSTEMPARTNNRELAEGRYRNVAGHDSNTVSESRADTLDVLGTTSNNAEQSLVVNLLMHLIGEQARFSDRLESKVDKMSARMETRFDQLVDQCSEIRYGISELDKKATATQKDVATLKADVATLTVDMATLKSDTVIVNSDFGTLKVEVQDLRKGSTTVNTDSEKIWELYTI